MLEHLSGRWKSEYFENISEIKNTISLPFILSKDMIKEHLDNFFISKLNEEIVKSNLPAYRQVKSLARGKFVNEGESSALTVGMKVNNCRDNPTQGKDRSRPCPFCPGEMASEFHVAWPRQPGCAQGYLSCVVTLVLSHSRIQCLSMLSLRKETHTLPTLMALIVITSASPMVNSSRGSVT